MSADTGSAMAVKVSESPPVDTEEIRGLASAAGYDVVGEVTQVRPEDPGTYLGAGKLAELAERTAEEDVSLVVVDDELSPGQTKDLLESLPERVRVFDRYRLILEIFGEQAETNRAQLQVELARLKYELPRIEENADVQPLNVAAEKGTRVHYARNRIKELESKLEESSDPTEQYREQRRQQGFDLVTIAGYTNAGKSTLLHRLADDMELEDAEPDHPDRDVTAAIEDRLFKTLDTTTRVATVEGRSMLLTDTVGLVQDLPHWMVKSFSTTLSEAAAADVVILVADASDSVEELREKLAVSLDVLDAQDVDRDAVVTALNKMDLLDAAERERKLAVASEVAPAVTPISVTEPENLDAMLAEVRRRLPTERAELEMPNCDEAMRVVSWIYDHASVEDVEYTGETVTLAVSGRPSIVEQARAKSNDVERRGE